MNTANFSNLIEKDGLKIIYILAVLESILLISIKGPTICADTPSYLFGIDSILNNKIDLFRTPTYPLFLLVIQKLLGITDRFLWFIIIQHVIFLVSVYFMYKMATSLSESLKISFWITMFYALYPGITFYNNMILTESLAISCSVFILYSAIRINEKGKFFNVFVFLWWLLFLIFLRPAFIYMLPVFAVAFVIMVIQKKNRIKQAILGVFGILLISGCLLSYMQSFKKKYGVFACSKVVAVNQYMTLRYYGMLEPWTVKDDKMKQFMNYYNHLEPPMDEIHFTEAIFGVDAFGVKYIYNLCSSIINKSPDLYIKYKIHQLYMSFAFSPHLTELYLFLMIYSILLLIFIIKNRTLPWSSFLLYMLGISAIIVAWIGAGIDMPRLLKPSISIYLLMITQCLSAFKRVKSVSELFN